MTKRLPWALAFCLVAAALLAFASAWSDLRAGGAGIARVLCLPLLLPAAVRLLSPLIRKVKSSRRGKIVAAVFIVGFAARLAPIVAVKNHQISDFRAYEELSRALLSGQGYAVTGEDGRRDLESYVGRLPALPYPTAFRAPGTALWGALLGANESLFKFGNAVLGAATGVMILLLADGAGPIAAGLAGLLWALYPSSIFAVNLYGSETLFAFCLAATALIVRRARPAAVGIAGAVCCLVRPLWPPLIVAAGGLGARRFKIFAAFLALGLAPWTLRNLAVFHRLVPIATDQGPFFALNSSFTIPASLRESPEYRRDWEAMSSSDEVAACALGYRIGLRNLKASYLDSGPKHAAASLVFAAGSTFAYDLDMILWAAADSFSYENGRGTVTGWALSQEWRTRWFLANHSFYMGLLLLAALGAVAGGKTLIEDPGSRFLLLYFLASFALFCVVPGTPRFHFPLMVAVAMLAGVGAQRIAK